MQFRLPELLNIGKSVSDNIRVLRRTIFSIPFGRMSLAIREIPIKSLGFFKDPIHKTLRRKNEKGVTSFGWFAVLEHMCDGSGNFELQHGGEHRRI